MKTVKKIIEGHYSATGSEITENGCIKFTHFVPGGKWAECDPETAAKCIADNPGERGNWSSRTQYVEVFNSWLKKIGRSELQIPIEYNIATETISRVLNHCECGNEWSEEQYTSDSPETDEWYRGVSPLCENFRREYTHSTEPEKTVGHKSCHVCTTKRKREKILELVAGLDAECISRQNEAVRFFEANPTYAPSDYTIVRRSRGYNPEINGRHGAQIGYTNKGRKTTHVCFIVRKSAA